MDNENNDLLIGLFAISRAGHDAGSPYIIVKESGSDVYVADGKSRTVENPKRKNRKHIQVVKKGVSPELMHKLQTEQSVSNEEAKRLIKLRFQI